MNVEHALGSPYTTKNTPHGLRELVRAFSPFERLLFAILTLATLVTGFVILYRLNNMLLVEMPSSGGEITEGVVGSPRFINPLLALSDADRDLSALVFAGLMRPSSDGVLKPTLASGYSVSDDGLKYRFFLRDDNVFSDGSSLTADDVVFTIKAIQNQTFKSPRYPNWEGIGVEKINDYTVEFTLPQAYAPFLENTTVGILPKHIWEQATPEEFPLSNYNIEPIGAGPYKVSSIQRGASGIPEGYTLVPNKYFSLGKPHMSRITIRFYHTEEEILTALKQGTIDAASNISPAALDTIATLPPETIHHSPLPRVFAVFFNQNKVTAFQEPEIRQALNMVTPKDGIISGILHGYASKLDGPLPPGILPGQATSTEETATASSSFEKAAVLLEKNGWERDETTHVWKKNSSTGNKTLSFTLSTTDVPELKDAAERIASSWRIFGADVELKVFEPTDLTQNIIRPRRYDALLFGEVIGREPDLYAFWHSSQRNDPGLNIALYANITTDKLLEDARATLSSTMRTDLYKQFDTLIRQEQPAIFLYAPDLVYILPTSIQNVSLSRVTSAEERFQNVEQWYVNTDHVWPFVKKLFE